MKTRNWYLEELKRLEEQGEDESKVFSTLLVWTLSAVLDVGEEVAKGKAAYDYIPSGYLKKLQDVGIFPLPSGTSAATARVFLFKEEADLDSLISSPLGKSSVGPVEAGTTSERGTILSFIYLPRV